MKYENKPPNRKNVGTYLMKILIPMSTNVRFAFSPAAHADNLPWKVKECKNKLLFIRTYGRALPQPRGRFFPPRKYLVDPRSILPSS